MKNIPSWHKDLPDENLDVYEPNLRLFFQCMFERQEIWYNRFILLKSRPWTKDPLLHNNKFTNVYRELDRNSQWQINNVFLKHTGSKINLIWKIMVFRYMNRPEFFDWMAKENIWKGKPIPDHDEFDEDKFYKAIIDFRATGENPFTNAYLINSQACPGTTRDWCYGHKVIPTLNSKLKELYKVILKAKKPEDIITFMKTLPAVADFIAHEFYQDFTYAPRYSGVSIMNFDQNDFTNVGPGASIGIRLIFPNLKGVKEQEQGIYWLRDLAREMLEENGDFKFLEWNEQDGIYYTSYKCNITLHQIEMWLCEFQKYWKMIIGKGKQRSVFKPKTKSI